MAVKEAALSAAADAILALGDEGETGDEAPCAPTGAAADHHRHDCPCHPFLVLGDAAADGKTRIDPCSDAGEQG